ncbi:SDR family oxidoreductase [Neobacillus mesonae]|uniref:3-oxoacyl-ACP reductase n=1 Tax=Neobacillus mesonae TaxID=1193713 RepID=A0A3Q9R049_9BACI|nr:SDR family oxidoreductase [Neobacillus mesonae]AZU63013.1 3-oxoacyl-ACP reductase [Neobacillus mesonae]MED4204064.1 SDR family oxidoreductase [Neobacillus mesonae]
MNKKTALITGGAAGIGKKTVIHLAEKGYQIAINYRNSESEAVSLAQYVEECYGIRSIAVQGDIARQEECERIVEETLSSFESVDVLIHNAGPYIHERKKMTDYSFEEWNYLLNGNLTSVFYLSKLVIPVMRKQNWGRIITMGFDRVESAPGWVYRSAFAAAKTGLASLTRTIAIEEAEYGITANMVSPGDITNEWKERNIQESRATFTGRNQNEREGTGEDIARVIGFLVDEQSDFITGSIIPVTGGMDVLGKVYKQ